MDRVDNTMCCTGSPTKVSRSIGAKRHPRPFALVRAVTYNQSISSIARIISGITPSSTWNEEYDKSKRIVSDTRRMQLSYLKKQSFLSVPLLARAYHVTQRDSSNGAGVR